MTSKKVAAAAVTNYTKANIETGDILTNATGTRHIRIIRSFVRKSQTTCPTVFVYSVINKAGQVSYNDQKTWKELIRSFPVKIA